MSAKSVTICSSYGKFSKVTQKHKCPLIGTGVTDRQVCVHANGKTSAHLKSVFKMSTVCKKSNASSKTWTPLRDCFIDDHLGGNVPTLRSGATSSGRRRVVAVHTILQLPPNLVVDYGLRSGLLAGHRAGVMNSGVS